MFDTFDILVPQLLSLAGVETRQRETAFGLDEDKHVFVRDVRIGRVAVASVAFSAVEAWAGASDRAQWTVLLLAQQASSAAQHDAAWAAYLDAVLTILEGHPTWRVTCESDCDQHPLVRLDLTPEELVTTLDQYRNGRHYPIAFYCEV